MSDGVQAAHGLSSWAGRPLPRLRTEAHFGDRLVSCFAQRPAHVWALFERALQRNPEAEALVVDGRRWTYEACARRIESVAAGLAELGITRGDRIALLLSNRAEFYFAYLASQRLGAIAVPIGTREQRDGVSFIVGQCGARAIVFDDAFTAAVPTRAESPELVRISCATDGMTATPDARTFDELAAVSAPAPSFVAPHEEDCCTLLYTSGTTGRPKGAMLTHLGIVHSVMHFEHCTGLGPATRAMLAVPASHVTGLVAIMLTAVGCGGTTVMMPAFSAGAFLELAARERIDYTVLVPAMYKLCLMQPDFDRHDLSAWTVGGYGGAPMPVSTIDELAQRLPSLRLVNAYGATETTSPATVMPSEFTREHADSVGVVVPAGRIVVMDDDGCEVAPGDTGELWISGPMVVRGYWANPQADAKEFTAGWWHSGDLGSVDSAGFVRVFDRKKDMINRGGYKVFSVEVENRLMAAPGVVEAAVVGVPCPVLGERVHAFVVVDDPALDAERLRGWCAEVLADYKVPETVRFSREALPRNANGKLLKRILRERMQTGDSPLPNGG